MMELMPIISSAVRILQYFFILHLLMALLTYFVVTALLKKHLRHLGYRTITHEKVPFEKFKSPRISILIPVFNEAEGIIDSVHAALSTDYPDYEIIVIDDGSSDETLAKLTQHFALQTVSRIATEQLCRQLPEKILQSSVFLNLYVVPKFHSGKADSLNAGISYSQGKYLCCIDSDSIITPDAMRKLVVKFINEPKLIALGGAIAPSNEIVVEHGEVRRRKLPKTLFVGIQIIEYLRSFTAWRTGWSYLDGLLIIGGALTVFEKSAVIKIGGYRVDATCEDLEIILSLHQYHLTHNVDYKIWAIPEVICWTRVPKNKADLKRQRIRWMWGALQSLQWHKQLMFNRKNILIGWFSFPHFVFIEAFAPIIELLGLLTLLVCALAGLLSFASLIIYTLLIFSMSGFYSWYALATNDHYIRSFPSLKQILRIGLVGMIEPFGYRQRDAYWRMIAWWYWLNSKPVKW